MYQYLIDFANDLIKRLEKDDEPDELFRRAGRLADELDRLDPRDFLPQSRYKFLEVTLEMRQWAKSDRKKWDRDRNDRHTLQSQIEFTARNPTQSTSESVALQDHAEHKDVDHNDVAETVSKLLDYRESVDKMQANEARKKEQEMRLEEAGVDLTHKKQLCQDVIDILVNYGGLGSYKTTRDFDFIKNTSLRAIIERNFRELTLVLLPSGAWKWAVIAAGSTLEAVLMELLTIAGQPNNDVNSIKPKRLCINGEKKAGLKSVDRWGLSDMLEASFEVYPNKLKSLKIDKTNIVDVCKALADYRNLIHPTKEMKFGMSCTDAEADLAVGILKSICNDLERAHRSEK